MKIVVLNSHDKLLKTHIVFSQILRSLIKNYNLRVE